MKSRKKTFPKLFPKLSDLNNCTLGIQLYFGVVFFVALLFETLIVAFIVVTDPLLLHGRDKTPQFGIPGFIREISFTIILTSMIPLGAYVWMGNEKMLMEIPLGYIAITLLMRLVSRRQQHSTMASHYSRQSIIKIAFVVYTYTLMLVRITYIIPPFYGVLLLFVHLVYINYIFMFRRYPIGDQPNNLWTTN